MCAPIWGSQFRFRALCDTFGMLRGYTLYSHASKSPVSHLNHWCATLRDRTSCWPFHIWITKGRKPVFLTITLIPIIQNRQQLAAIIWQVTQDRPAVDMIEIEPSELPQASIRPNSCGAQHTEFTRSEIIGFSKLINNYVCVLSLVECMCERVFC